MTEGRRVPKGPPPCPSLRTKRVFSAPERFPGDFLAPRGRGGTTGHAGRGPCERPWLESGQRLEPSAGGLSGAGWEPPSCLRRSKPLSRLGLPPPPFGPGAVPRGVAARRAGGGGSIRAASRPPLRAALSVTAGSRDPAVQLFILFYCIRTSTVPWCSSFSYTGRQPLLVRFSYYSYTILSILF